MNAMAAPADDAAAIAASLTDPKAFTEVFERHFDTVDRFLRRRIGAAVADDLAAETFLQAFEGRSRYRLDRPDARPWLFGIAVNLLRRHLRREERQLRAYARSGVDPVLVANGDVDARADTTAAGPRLAAALAELRPAERDVLLLYAWADLDYAEIAEALAIPIGTVRSRLSRARAAVKERMGPTQPLPLEDTHSEVTDG